MAIRKDGRYAYKYVVNGKVKFIYSFRLNKTNPLPKGKRPCKSLLDTEDVIANDTESKTALTDTQVDMLLRFLQTDCTYQKHYHAVIVLKTSRLRSATMHTDQQNPLR